MDVIDVKIEGVLSFNYTIGVIIPSCCAILFYISFLIVCLYLYY